MLIRVEHATSYEYSEPLLATTQYLRMTPLSGRTQAVESWALSCPGAVMTPWHDQYGNVCHTLTVPNPVEHLDIKVCGLVRTRDTNGVVGTASSELPSGLYLRETPYTVVTESIRAFAERFETGPKEDLITSLHEIMLAIADAVDYRPGDTHVHTTGAEALEQGSGVCQDQAHIFCAVCRALGIPARYVSGYLTHGLGHDAHAASHAWAEALVDSLGWVGFDPTNRACPDESYIRTAVGLDYGEAGPVRGVRAGGGVETMTVRVSFPSQQAQ
ncbi:MAG: transglutaminase family protein [Methyloceanibacter sp.]|uniref:transglutaminase family protein n=1 Tax=Methyloceanibacter sp. TaxID=1965321 RepID=UPI003D6CB374